MTGIVQNTLLLTSANLAIRLISILFTVYLSGRLGPAGLGLIQLISSVCVLALTVGSSGIRIAAMYLCAEEYGKGRTGGVRAAADRCLVSTLLLGSAAGLFLMLLSRPLAERWLAEPAAAASLRMIGFFLPVVCMNSVMTGYFTACGKIRSMVTIELTERVLCVLLTMLLLRSAATAEACCLAYFAGSSLTCAASFLSMYLIYRRDCARFAPIPDDLRMGQRLLRLCVPLAANEYLRSGLSTLENLLIPHGLRRYGISGDGAMASYGVIHGMVFPVLTFASCILYSLADVLMPELSRCRAAGEQRRIQMLTDRCLRWGLVFSAAAAGLLGALAEPLGRLLYRSGEAALYIGLLAPMIPVLYLDTVVDGMHKGLGQQLCCVRYNTLTSFLDVVFLFCLLPRYGISGFLFSFTVTHLLNFFLSLRRLIRVTQYRVPLTFSARAVLLAALCALLIRILCRAAPPNAAGAVLLALGYLALYFISLTVSGVWTERDRLWAQLLFRGAGRAVSGRQTASRRSC